MPGPTAIRTGATSSPSPAGPISCATRASRRSARACATSRLYQGLGTIAGTRTNAEWLAELDRHNIPAMIVNSLEMLLRDPQLEATGFWQLVEHPSEGTLRLPGIPATYSKTPGDIRRLPPRLGEHSLEVLREAGLGEREIGALLASRATRAAQPR